MGVRKSNRMCSKKQNDIIKFNSISDDRGSLCPLNFKNIPFNIKHMFLISNVPNNVIRGNHAHYLTKQLVICLNGQLMVFTHNKKGKGYNILNQNEGILIPKLTWSWQKYFDNASALVLMSKKYNPQDYIRDIGRFYELINYYEGTKNVRCCNI